MNVLSDVYGIILGLLAIRVICLSRDQAWFKMDNQLKAVADLKRRPTVAPFGSWQIPLLWKIM